MPDSMADLAALVFKSNYSAVTQNAALASYNFSLLAYDASVQAIRRALDPAVEVLVDKWDLKLLPAHYPHILMTALGYHLLCSFVSPLALYLNPWTSKLYRSSTDKAGWNSRVVAFFQAIIVSTVALRIVIWDPDFASMSPSEMLVDRVWASTDQLSLAAILASGYFVWDLLFCLGNLDSIDPFALVHAILALSVYTFGFRPFVIYYGPVFILYELSTPFLHLTWLLRKLKLDGTAIYVASGVLLIVTFAGCRLVYGVSQAWVMFHDLWAAYHADKNAIFAALPDSATDPVRAARLTFIQSASDLDLPAWLPLVYVSSNVLLTCLNVFWLSSMVAKAVSIYRGAPEKKPVAAVGSSKPAPPVSPAGKRRPKR